jgi:hypothetical protein
MSWLSSLYSWATASSPAPPVVQPREGTVTASVLNLRAEPDGPVTGKLPRGTKVALLAEDGDWLKVRAPQGEGYVSARFVAFDPTQATPPPPAGVPPEASEADLQIRDGALYGPGGVRVGSLFKAGLYNRGQTDLADFVAAEAARFPAGAASLLRVLRAVSGNEGKLEALNTWDDCFLSFGALQWTAGPAAAAGELPALLDRLKRTEPDTFEAYFARYGLDCQGVAPGAGTVPTGFLALGGQRLADADAKAVLRQPIWAYRFWRAAHDPAMRRCQVEHAMARVDVFYRLPRPALGGRAVSDYVSSEYGVALLLDEHVNRPGHVPGTLGAALRQLTTGGGLPDPAGWTDADEAKLLDLYLEARQGTSMTDSEARADRISQAADAGQLSRRRGSFVSTTPELLVRAEGIEPPTTAV